MTNSEFEGLVRCALAANQESFGLRVIKLELVLGHPLFHIRDTVFTGGKKSLDLTGMGRVVELGIVSKFTVRDRMVINYVGKWLRVRKTSNF